MHQAGTDHRLAHVHQMPSQAMRHLCSDSIADDEGAVQLPLFAIPSASSTASTTAMQEVDRTFSRRRSVVDRFVVGRQKLQAVLLEPTWRAWRDASCVGQLRNTLLEQASRRPEARAKSRTCGRTRGGNPKACMLLRPQSADRLSPRCCKAHERWA